MKLKLENFNVVSRWLVITIVALSFAIIGSKYLTNTRASSTSTMTFSSGKVDSTYSKTTTATIAGGCFQANAVECDVNPATIPSMPNCTSDCSFSTLNCAPSNMVACNKWWLYAINYARSIKEGLGPINIDINLFSAQPQNVQDFIITNIEREDRGVAPIPEMTSSANCFAQWAANSGYSSLNEDIAVYGYNPTTKVNPTGCTALSNTPQRGGNMSFTQFGDSVLYSDFGYMYQDGWSIDHDPSSPTYNQPNPTNGDCSSSSNPAYTGCWGHRINELHDYSNGGTDASYMGIGINYNGSNSILTTMELYVDSSTTPTDVYFPTWNSICSQGILSCKMNPIEPGTSPVKACSATNNLGSVLYTGTNLSSPNYIQSPNGQYRLCNDNGYITEWKLWTSKTYHPELYGTYSSYFWSITNSQSGSNYLAVQSDGNLVYKTSAGNTISVSATNGWWDNSALPDTLTIDNNGNLELKNLNGQTVWSEFYGRTTKNAHMSTDGSTSTQCLGSTLYGEANQYMTNNTCLISPDGTYMLYFNSAGYLQEVNGLNQLVWAPNLYAPGGSFKIQRDGNLVLYNSSGTALWSSKTTNSGSLDKLVLQNDGNLVVVSSAGQAVWSKNTGKVLPPPINLGTTLYVNQSLYPNEELVSTVGRVGTYYRLILQLDGNLVSYNQSNYTNCNPSTFPCTWANYLPSRLTMQSDGNLVFYNYQNIPIWSSGTKGTGSNDYVVMQADGNIVIFNGYNQAVWSKDTGRLYPTPPPPPPTNLGSTLGTEQVMWPNQEIVASNGTRLIYQLDGNLVEYNSSNTWVWQTYTSGRSLGGLKMQSDGNLVLYNDYGGVLWASGSNGRGSNDYLVIGGDGNFIIESNHNIPVWGLYNGLIPEYPPNYWASQPLSMLFSHQILYPNQSITTSGYRLTYQPDGNLVEYNSAGQWVWQTYTYGRSTGNLKMQDDGNLVLYNDYGGVLWSSGTSGSGGANYLIVQPDGNLVVYTASGVPVWHRY